MPPRARTCGPAKAVHRAAAQCRHRRTLAAIASAGANSFGGTIYMGPKKTGTTCIFKLYALSGRLEELPRGASRAEVIQAMKGKVLGALEGGWPRLHRDVSARATTQGCGCLHAVGR